ncbi:MAG: acyltransferase [Pirellulales bacterium]|nr:acyltransferase [Pirellulales bacterium]
MTEPAVAMTNVDSASEPSRAVPPAAGALCRPYDVESLRAAGALVGRRARIAPDVTVDCPERLEIGDDVEIGAGVRLMTAGGVTIGDRAIISPGAQVLSSTPSIPRRGRPVSAAPPLSAQIDVDADAWIGPGAILLPGVQVGAAAIVLAGSVVAGSVANSRIVRGNPASYHMTRNHI